MPDYSPRSVEVYGKPEGPWLVKDSGELYKGLKILSINSEGWEIISTADTVGPFLKTLARSFWGADKFGEVSPDKIEKARQYTFGLNPETRNGTEANEPLATGIILPELKKQMEEQTGLKF